jgi:hypothetical protein
MKKSNNFIYRNFKRIIAMKKTLIPIFFLLMAVSCATVKVTSDFDKSAQFAGYKTYAFTPEALNLNIDELNRKRVVTAVEQELSLKGFTKAEKPDVLIDLKLTSQAKQTATASTSGMYGVGYRYRWGGGFSATTIDYDNYIEGTLFVDMIDASESQLVWQGRAVGTINPDAKPEKREANINNAVKQIFMKYPPKL